MIYYIYEVPGEKNGATKDWETRRAYNFNEYQIEPIIVETMEGPDTEEYWQVVGDREWYYADLNGYKRGQHYRVAVLARIAAGLLQGSKNVESGHIHRLSSYRTLESYKAPRPTVRKLTQEHVDAMFNDIGSYRVLALKYNVSTNIVSRVKKGIYKAKLA